MRRAWLAWVNSIERSGRLETSLCAMPGVLIWEPVVLRLHGVWSWSAWCSPAVLPARRRRSAPPSRSSSPGRQTNGLDGQPHRGGRVQRGEDAHGSVADDCRHSPPIEDRLHVPRPRQAADLAVDGARSPGARPGRPVVVSSRGPGCTGSIRKARCAPSGELRQLFASRRAGPVALASRPSGSRRCPVAAQIVSRRAGGRPRRCAMDLRLAGTHRCSRQRMSSVGRSRASSSAGTRRRRRRSRARTTAR